MKTNASQKYVHTTLLEAKLINATLDTLSLFVPNFIPSLETQIEFNQSKKTSFTPYFDSWTTD